MFGDVEQLFGHFARMLIAINAKDGLEQLRHLVGGLVPHGGAQVNGGHGKYVLAVMGVLISGGGDARARLVEVGLGRQLVEAAPIEHHARVQQ